MIPDKENDWHHEYVILYVYLKGTEMVNGVVLQLKQKYESANVLGGVFLKTILKGSYFSFLRSAQKIRIFSIYASLKSWRELNFLRQRS